MAGRGSSRGREIGRFGLGHVRGTGLRKRPRDSGGEGAPHRGVRWVKARGSVELDAGLSVGQGHSPMGKWDICVQAQRAPCFSGSPCDRQRVPAPAWKSMTPVPGWWHPWTCQHLGDGASFSHAKLPSLCCELQMPSPLLSTQRPEMATVAMPRGPDVGQEEALSLFRRDHAAPARGGPQAQLCHPVSWPRRPRPFSAHSRDGRCHRSGSFYVLAFHS